MSFLPAFKSYTELEEFATAADVALAKMLEGVAQVAAVDEVFTALIAENTPKRDSGLPYFHWDSLSETAWQSASERVGNMARFIASQASHLLAPPFVVDLPFEDLVDEANGAKFSRKDQQRERIASFSAAKLTAALKCSYGQGAGKSEALKKAANHLFKKFLHGYRRGEEAIIDPKKSRRGVTFFVTMWQDSCPIGRGFKFAYNSSSELRELGAALRAFGNWAMAPEADQWEADLREMDFEGKFRGKNLDCRMKCEIGGITLTIFREKIEFTFTHDLAQQLQEFFGLHRDEKQFAA
jgi:hypothetical protein